VQQGRCPPIHPSSGHGDGSADANGPVLSGAHAHLAVLQDSFRCSRDRLAKLPGKRGVPPGCWQLDCVSGSLLWCGRAEPLWVAKGLLLASVPTWASASRGSARSAPRGASRSASRTKARSNATRYKSPATKCTSCTRAANGKIARSPAARRSFQASHPCPATGRTSGACPGFVVDHIKPLKRGGADAPSNMQWQTRAEARAKDRIE
jgi:hypothetical protein